MLYLLMCIYVAFYYIRPTEWVPGLIGLPIFLALGIICILLLLEAMLSKKLNLLAGDSERMMLGFIIAIALSHLSHGYIGGVTNSLNNILPLIVCYFLITATIVDRQKLNRFILVLILLSTFLAFEGLLQHKTGFSHGGMTPCIEEIQGADDVVISSVKRIRWYGVFNDPNDLGLALVLALPFLLNMLINKRYLLPLICFPIISTAVFFTNSRGSVLAAIASIMAYFVIRFRSMKGIVIGLLSAGILIVFGPSRMAEMSASEDSAYGRLESWYEGYQMFKSHPLFGVGQGMYTDYHYLTAHNSFVQVMAELGIFGTFCFTGLIYFPINMIWRNVFCEKVEALSDSDLGILSAVSGCFIGLLTAMFFLSRAYVLIPYIVIALAIACIRICIPNLKEESSTTLPTKKHYRNIALLSIMQIIFINIMVKVFI
jgi:putative inorganic carbon (hco3(-)) transporter